MIPVTLGIPELGTRCLCYGMCHGDPGYTPDEMEFRRCVVKISEYTKKPELISLEPSSRYDMGYIPTHWAPYEVTKGMEAEAERILDGHKE